MQLVYHSPEGLFTDTLKEYAEDKFTRPLIRHKLDDESARIDVDASTYRQAIALRLRVVVPGLTVTLSTLHSDPNAAIDLAADKLSRKLRDVEERRRDIHRRNAPDLASLASLDDEATDIFTQDEEEVLREMGALDAVLNL